MVSATVSLNLRTAEAFAQAKAAVLAATKDVFELHIVPQAKENSPVTPEGYARNLELEAEHKLGDRRAMGTGTNRRSIDSTVVETSEGVEAQMYTTSGYGGWLETGTSKMRAQPYLYPAFEQHIGKLADIAKEKISE